MANNQIHTNTICNFTKQQQQWKGRKTRRFLHVMVFFSFIALASSSSSSSKQEISVVDRQLIKYVDDLLYINGTKSIIPGVCVERIQKNNCSTKTTTEKRSFQTAIQADSIEDYLYQKWDDFTKNHVLSLNVPQTARFFTFGQGKSSFLTGFGMGFAAFFLKKLLLPVFIIAQIFKSVLIAMFLPSILGSIGKLVGKGLSTVSGVSGSSAGGGHTQMEDFEFKDTSPYNGDLNVNGAEQDFNSVDNSFAANNVAADTTIAPQAMNRFGFVNQRIYQQTMMNMNNMNSDNYYIRQPAKKTDFKVFHKIPSSSLLLTSYDPFYSPLLSRLDAVFQQLGLGAGKSMEMEKCRERMVCLMYANPAKYAPYSNLVSAQLSRELNELRKPSSDNPEILRFFRYMKAAKDGQDGEECLAHSGCPSLTSNLSPAMLTTYQDINKLVQARKFK